MTTRPHADEPTVQRLLSAQLSEFAAVVSDSFVPLIVTAPHRPGFRGTMHSAAAAGVQATLIEAGAHTVERTPGLIARGDEPQFKLSVMRHGTALLIQDGREAVLRPGDIAVYDTSRPYSMVLDDDFSMVVLMLGREMLGLPVDSVRALSAVALRGDSGLGAIASPFLRQLGTHLEQLPAPGGPRLAGSAVGLVAALLANQLDSGEAALGGHAALVARLRDYIEANLASPALSPASIAAANFVSVRHLHKLFHEQGITVSGWIRSRRLEACRRELADPLLGDLPVSVVAGRWGFTDAAHFSRVFRAAFGAPPSEFRAHAVAARPRATSAVRAPSSAECARPLGSLHVGVHAGERDLRSHP